MSDEPHARGSREPEPPERAAPSVLAYRGSIAALVLGSFLALFLVLRPPADESRAGPVLLAPTATPTAAATPEATPAPPAATAPPTTPTPPAATETPTTPTPPPMPSPIEYTVVSGDTLSDIVDSFGVTLEAILALNPGLDPDAIGIGQIILVPRP